MHTQHVSRRVGVIAGVGAIAIAVALTGCTTSGNSGNGGSNDSIKIAYIQKQGDQQYFIDEANGAKEEAGKLGATVNAINVGNDANNAISQLNTVISQGYDAIAIVVPDQKIGPQVIDAAKKAGIPLLASDDAISDASGKAAPFVGFSGADMGKKVGAEAAALFKKESGWDASNTKFVTVSKPDLQTCEDRVNNAYEQFGTDAGVTLPRITLGTDNTVTDAQNKTSAAITANQGVKHWVVVGCNDETETGSVTALQNAGIAPADIIGVGLGAYLTCKDWKAGTQSGNKAALFISGKEVGSAAVSLLVDAVKNKQELPASTIAKTSIVDATNWESAGVACT